MDTIKVYLNQTELNIRLKKNRLRRHNNETISYHHIKCPEKFNTSPHMDHIHYPIIAQKRSATKITSFENNNYIRVRIQSYSEMILAEERYENSRSEEKAKR